MERNISQHLKDAVDAEYLRLFPKQPFIPGESVVTVSGKSFDREEFLLMTQAVMDGWWTEGHFTKKFEIDFAITMKRTFCITTNSGSSANLLALTALTSAKLGDRRLKPGDEVITVAASFPTTVTPILQLGCVPVFVDIELPSYNINIERMKEARTEKTRAVMVAHTLGNPFQAKEIRDFCDEHNLWFIEDCCDAIGGTYQGQPVGTFGDIATVSFYPAHHITMGEGGALLTSDGTLNKIIRSFRDWGRDCWCAPGVDNTCGIRFDWKLGTLPKGYDHKYIYSEVGYNLKITDTQAALGLAQLKKLPSFIERRKHNHKMLRDGLKPFSDWLILPEPTPGSDPSWFGFLFTIGDKAPFTRAEFVAFLQTKKVATRYLFAGNILRQPVFTTYNHAHRVVGDLTMSDIVTERTLWIGCHPGLTDEMLTYVIACFKEFVESYRSKIYGKHVLLTGSSGFLGKRVLSRLRSDGARVTTISRSDANATIQGSLLDKEVHDRITSQGPYDAVIHLAAAGVDPKTTEREILEVNIVGTQMLLQTLTALPACPVVVTGSWTEYGPPTGSVMSEEQICHPRSIYGISKLAATLNALTWSEKNDRPLAVLRLFSLYGADERSDRLFPTLAQAVRGAAVRLNDPEQVRDFVHVDDAVESIVRAISQKGIAQLVNVGTGRGYRIGEIVDLLSEKCNKKLDVTWNPQKLLPWSVPSAVADIDRCRTILGWTPSAEINFTVFG